MRAPRPPCGMWCVHGCVHARVRARARARMLRARVRACPRPPLWYVVRAWVRACVRAPAPPVVCGAFARVCVRVARPTRSLPQRRHHAAPHTSMKINQNQ